ncbi:UDP-N-acetylmuramoyl-L-alanine--D-glutamate ligase [Candidatus Woesebacteria bacterium]|nr:UDP-N-acetylmuramoyl-L-alanine--D-glutamate ligase [Candidatus Woesebacteria bacterium]
MSLQDIATTYLEKLCAGRTIIIFGLAQEGYSTYHFLRKTLPHLSIIAADDKPITELSDNWQQALAQDSALTYLSTTAPGYIETLTTSTQGDIPAVLIFKTPGIPFTHQFLQDLALAELEDTYCSNTELFFAIITQLPLEMRPQTIGISGTKGKSTTTSLIYHVLSSAGKTVYLAGNIGVPVLHILEEIAALPVDTYSEILAVLELSSHQLQDLPYSPHIAVIQNVTPEHLDYYQDFEEYVAAKSSLTKHQHADDYVVYNPQYEIPAEFATASPAQRLTYSLELEPPRVVGHIKNGIFFYNNTPITAIENLPLKGAHNLLNAFPAILIAELFGIAPNQVTHAFKTFKPLPHRLEFVAEKNQLKFYNDSQGTTPEAAIAALRSFPDNSVILLAGGSEKGVSFDEFAEEILEHGVKKLVLFPPTGVKIEGAVRAAAIQKQAEERLPEITHAHSMQEAFDQATEAAAPGSVVLLSPACASFGLFKNYIDRGNQFKACVERL